MPLWRVVVAGGLQDSKNSTKVCMVVYAKACFCHIQVYKAILVAEESHKSGQ